MTVAAAMAAIPLAGCTGDSGGTQSLPDASDDAVADVVADVSVCGPGTTQCGASCTSTDVDPMNCGSCGKACAAGQFCSSGACTQGCQQGQTACTTDGGAGYCVNAMTDNQNCGACGQACATGLVCSNGKCATSCAQGLLTCGGGGGSDAGADASADASSDASPADAGSDGGSTAPYCADPDTDRLNCGGCGVQCGAGEICVGGSCAASCASPLIKCGNACVDPLDDPGNCGGCGTTCGTSNAAGFCSGGACTLACNGGFADCNKTNSDGCEVNTTSDANNCGTCGNACGTGTPFCVVSECSWLRGQPWKASSSTANNGQTITPLPGSADSEQFTYADTTTDVHNGQSFTFEAIATSSITLGYIWEYSGYHAYFQTGASLTAYADGPGGLTTVTLVPNQAVGGGFSFVGKSSLTVTQGYKFGFAATGTNFDSDHRLLGTLKITRQ